MKITFYGHSCFSAVINGKTILFDPFVTGNALAKHIDVTTIKADYILVSHGHEDHVGDLISIAKRTGAKIVCSWEIHSWLNKQGVENTHPMNTGGSWPFDFGKIKCVVAVHSNSLPDGTYGGAAMGFIIESTDGNFYYSGDTALTLDMKLIGNYKKIDFALMPIGGNFTMNVDNAIIATNFINCKKVVGLHYDTFGYIVIDHNEAIAKFKDANAELILLNIGESREM